MSEDERKEAINAFIKIYGNPEHCYGAKRTRMQQRLKVWLRACDYTYLKVKKEINDMLLSDS